jgi:hypothetical protein
MNKELKIYGIFIMIIATLLFFEFKNPGNNKDQLTNLANLSAIEKVIVNIPCNLYIQESDEQKLMIEYNGGIFNEIKTSIDSDGLTIDGTVIGSLIFTLESLMAESPQINIYISLKDIEDLRICEYCKASTKGSINKQQLNLSVDQSGVQILIDKKA